MTDLAARVILLWGWRRVVVAVLAGACAVLALPPYDFFPAGFVSFTVLVWLLDGVAPDPGDRLVRRLRGAFTVGWWFGFGYFVAGLWWVGRALLVDADNFAWALPIAVLGLPAVLAIFYGLATALARLAWADGIGRIVALAAAFGIAEWLRSFVLTGFPWNAVGYAAMPVPVLMQSVGIVGLFGMNALAVLVFAIPALAGFRRHRGAGVVVGLLLVGAHLGYGVYQLYGAPPPEGGRRLQARVVQPSVSQSGKWDPQERARIMQSLLDLSARPAADGQERPDLIVWPETALPFVITDRPDALAAIGAMLEPGQTLFLGAVRSEAAASERDKPRYYNAVVAINDGGEIVDAVDKQHLVPFGEYLPFQDLFEDLGFKTVAETVGGFSSGSMRRALSAPGGIGALPMICYEIIFPDLLAGARAQADIVVNVTNDAWFGDTAGPYQHFRQAQVRAVEVGMPLIRAANNGISAVVDEKGRVIDGFAVDAVGSFDVALFVPDVQSRPEIDAGRNGLLIILFFATLACGMNIGQRLRSK
ncbi:MAG: apolipoprotein N-acyltransferase [Nitratireductor sp.]